MYIKDPENRCVGMRTAKGGEELPLREDVAGGEADHARKGVGAREVDAARDGDLAQQVEPACTALHVSAHQIAVASWSTVPTQLGHLRMEALAPVIQPANAGSVPRLGARCSALHAPMPHHAGHAPWKLLSHGTGGFISHQK